MSVIKLEQKSKISEKTSDRMFGIASPRMSEEQHNFNQSVIANYYPEVMDDEPKSELTKEEKPVMTLKKQDVLEHAENILHEATSVTDGKSNPIFEDVTLQKNGKFVAEWIEPEGHPESGIVDTIEGILDTSIEVAENKPKADGEINFRTLKFTLEDWKEYRDEIAEDEEAVNGNAGIESEDPIEDESGLEVEQEEEDEETIPESNEEQEEAPQVENSDKVFPDTAVETFNNIMLAADIKVNVWKNGVSYWNDIAQLMYMAKQKFYRLQLIGATPEEYPEMKFSNFRKQPTPYFDFCNAELDGKEILRQHINNMSASKVV